MASIAEIYPITADRDDKGGLRVASLPVVDLAKKYRTPLYLFDAATIFDQAASLRAELNRAFGGQFEITYAAKAYFSLPFARKLAALDLGVDVVSQGELRVAMKAGFAPNRVHLHGNNKGADEVDEAIAWGVQAIVIDSLEELDFIEARAAAQGRIIRAWLRVTPGLAVDTHPYRQTGHASSKFGLSIQAGSAAEGIRKVAGCPHLRLSGLHTHLGSQVFEADPYRRAVGMLMEVAAQCGFQPEELSPGGGWGVPYTLEDEASDPRLWIGAVSDILQHECKQRGFPLPKLVVEPGRWLVARAGLAVYSIGTSKIAGDGSRVVAVDGGMADNLRPALYHARYTACLAERPDAKPIQTVRVVGKFCESGDELIPAVDFPEFQRGEHLVMPASGAYHLSMASNYNLAARPAVVWLEAGREEILQVRSEAFEDPWWVGAG